MRNRTASICLWILLCLLIYHVTHAQTTHDSLLFEAVKKNDLGAVKSLVFQGANVNATDTKGATVIMWAAYKGDINLVKFLVRSGADVSKKGIIYIDTIGSYYGNLTGIAAGENKLEILKYFIEERKIPVDDKGWDPADNSESRWTALQWGSAKGHVLIINYLLKKGANIDQNHYKDKGTPLMYSMQNNHPNSAKLLIEKGANVNLSNTYGWTALHYAAWEGNIKLVFELLIHGANPNVQTDSLWTPLYLAVRNTSFKDKRLDILKILFSFGASMDLKYKSNMTLLDVANSYADQDIIRFLEKPFVDFYFLLKHNLDSMVVDCLDKNPNMVNQPMQEGKTLLFYAVYFNSTYLFDYLLSHGANLNVRDSSGVTPVSYAIFLGNEAKVIKLIDNNADINVLDKDGVSSLDLAIQRDYLNLEKLLKSKGGKPGSVDQNNTHLVLPIGHTWKITSICFSPNGKYILSGSYDSSLKLWDVQSGNLISSIDGSSYFESLCFSPDGRSALSYSWDGELTLWDIQSGKRIRSFEGYNGTFSPACFSPDGKYILSGSNDNTMQLWEIKSGKLLMSFEGHTSIIKYVCFTKDGKQVISGSLDKTLKLWDVQSGLEIHSYPGNTDESSSICFSPDNNYVLSGAKDNTLKLWDIKSGKEIKSFKGHTEGISSVCFSPDSRYALSGSEDNTLKLWDINSGKEMKSFEGHKMSITSVCFSPDGRYAISGSEDNTIKLWDIQSGRLIRSFEGHTNWVSSVCLSSNGRYAISGSWDKYPRLWDFQSGKLVRSFQGHTSNVNSVSFSPDNRFALSGSCDSTIKLWDNQSGNLLKSFVGHTGIVTSACFSVDGQSVLSGSFDSTLRLWDVQSGKQIKSITRNAGKVVAVSLSLDSHYAMSSSYDGTFKLWDVQSGIDIKSFDGQYTYLRFFPVSPDGKFIITVFWNNTMKLWDIQSGKNIQSFKGQFDIVYGVCFSHDGKYLLSGSLNRTIKLWDVQSGKEVKNFNGHKAAVQSVCFSNDDRYVLSGSYDNTMKLWDIQSGKELATLISIDSTDWAVFTPAGLFDASPGAMKLMYFVTGLEIIELDQLKERYYEPGLLSKLLGYNKEPMRHSEIFDKVKLYPEITAEQVSDGKSLKVHLKNRGGGIGKVIVSINGKEITADARGPQQNPDADSITLSIDVINHPYLIPGKENTIEIKAKNGEGSIVSRGVNIIYTPPLLENIDTTMQVFILCSGISDYNGAEIDLRYAAKDAREMADALQTGAKRLFGSDKTYTWLLTTENKENNKKPTRKNIVNAFDEISLQAHPNDILVIYLSGHGINWGGQDGDFYYLTQDAFSANPEAYNDSEIRKSSAISSNELVELIKKVNVTKQVLIIDACASGRMIENLLAKKEISSSTIRALTFMQNRTASYIIAGCTSDQSSYEASRYGQGVLTYSLLEGIKGAALDEGKLVEVNSLFRHANLRVPDLAKGIGGIQEPRIISPPERKPFYIGQMNDIDKQNIHLSEPKPLFLMTNFQDEEMMKDVLGLGKIVDEALRDVSFRGTEAPLIFLDTRDFPDAYSLSGRYTVSGNQVTLKVNLFKGSEKKQTMKLTGVNDGLKVLVDNIINQLDSVIK